MCKFTYLSIHSVEVNHYIKPILKVGRRIDADEFKLLHHFVGELVE